MSDRVYLWRAWSHGDDRLCDSGIVVADSAPEAIRRAWYCTGGPHNDEIADIRVELVPSSDDAAVATNFVVVVCPFAPDLITVVSNINRTEAAVVLRDLADQITEGATP